jgi:LysM repeat protein/LAS superfamily LD-carboxypeptidase LdcB
MSDTIDPPRMRAPAEHVQDTVGPLSVGEMAALIDAAELRLARKVAGEITGAVASKGGDVIRTGVEHGRAAVAAGAVATVAFTAGTGTAAAHPQSEKPPVVGFVQPGDTLWKRAEKLGVSEDKLAADSGIQNKDEIRPGQPLRLDKQTEPPAPAQPENGNCGPGHHRVKAGETSTKIAKDHGMESVEQFGQLNNLENIHLIYKGQCYKVQAVQSHVVQPGETLSEIAKKHGTTVEAIMPLNPHIKDANMIPARRPINLPLAAKPGAQPEVPAAMPPPEAVSPIEAETAALAQQVLQHPHVVIPYESEVIWTEDIQNGKVVVDMDYDENMDKVPLSPFALKTILELANTGNTVIVSNVIALNEHSGAEPSMTEIGIEIRMRNEAATAKVAKIIYDKRAELGIDTFIYKDAEQAGIQNLRNGEPHKYVPEISIFYDDSFVFSSKIPEAAPSPVAVAAVNIELPAETIPKIEAMKPGALALEPLYRQAEEATGVPWEILAAIHYQEANNDPGRDLQAGNRLGTGGPMYSVRGAQPDLLTSLINAGNDLQHSAEHGRFGKRIDRANLDLELIKYVLFGHNGRSKQYAHQASHYGFDSDAAPYEGSPYVVEGLTPQQQGMGRITRDHGGIDGVAKRPGALTVAIGLGLLDAAPVPPRQAEAPVEDGIVEEVLEAVPEVLDGVLGAEQQAVDPRLDHPLIDKNQEIRPESNGVETVEVQGIRIRVDAALNLARLLEHAKADGFNFSSSPRGAFRSFEDQAALRKENGCGDIYSMPPSTCRIQTARPGESNHESHPDDPTSYAVDFHNNGVLLTSWRDPAAQWLKENGHQYGFYGEIPSEPWHWSGTGR